jgi:predicted secreted protein
MADAFVSRLNAAGDDLVYSTYLGGKAGDGATSVALDANGSAYVTGWTTSSDFPVANVVEGNHFGGYDGFAAKLQPNGTLSWSRYLDDPYPQRVQRIWAIAADGNGAAFIVGGDRIGPVVMKLTPSAKRLVFPQLSSTNAVLSAVAIDSHGIAYIAGYTTGTTLPLVNPLQPTNAGSGDAIVAKIDTSLNIVPQSASVHPHGAITFTAYGGDGDYTWGFSRNGSAGTIDATGHYVAGSFGRATDVVTVKDAANHTASVSVAVSAAISISPSSVRVFPNEEVDFYAVGGEGDPAAYTWSFIDYRSLGDLEPAIDANKQPYGYYIAGYTGDVTDTIQVTDTVGATAIATITIGDALVLTPSDLMTVAPQQSVTFQASGGKPPYTFGAFGDGGSLISSSDVSAVYRAGTTGNKQWDNVCVSDSTKNAVPFCVAIAVGPGVSITPAQITLAPLQKQILAVSGGSHTGYNFSFVENNSHGSLIASTGEYQAGATPGAIDSIAVTDSLNNRAVASITIGPSLSLQPGPTATTPPLGTINFVASGGTNSGLTWQLLANGSGATLVDGTYVAGATTGGSDTVQVTDSAGNTAKTIVTLTAGVSISPAQPATLPGQKISFTASGGSNSGFKWSLTKHDSGATIDDAGHYTAGPTNHSSDVVQVKDSLGNIANASVSVGDGIVIDPTSPTLPPKAQQTFTARGGSGGGYLWSITDPKSGGKIKPTGEYQAGATGGVTDTISVVDSNGNVTITTVTVSAGLSVTPLGVTVAPNGTQAFHVSGGSGVYSWSVQQPSSGSIDANGLYTAGGTPDTTDIIQVSDSLGNVITAVVGIGDALQVTPSTTTLPPRGTLDIAVRGGSGGYTFSLTTNGSGGMVSTPGGEYVAGVSSGNDVVLVKDSVGNQATVSIQVGPVVSVWPAAPSVSPRGAVQLIASGGSGGGWSWRFTSNRSGATIDASGNYRAGDKPDVSDRVQVSDSYGNVAVVDITVGDAAAIHPAMPTVPPRGQLGLQATGVACPCTWKLTAAPSGGSIDSHGQYRAGAVGNVTDIVSMADSNGASATMNIAVTSGIVVSPADVTVKAGSKQMMSVQGGSGTGYQWSLATNGSGGTIDSATGLYQAGPHAGTDSIHVVDSLGNSADATVKVTPSQTSGQGGGTSSGLGASGGGCSYAIGGVSGQRGSLFWVCLFLIGLGISTSRRARTLRRSAGSNSQD